MNCPHCGTPTEADLEHDDRACPECGLAGPVEALASLAARLKGPSGGEIALQAQLDAAREALPADVLAACDGYVYEAIRALRAPAFVLAEAERLLRRGGASVGPGGSTGPVALRRASDGKYFVAPTLVELFGMLTEGVHG